MKQLVILSGKGGTGKTSVAVALLGSGCCCTYLPMTLRSTP
jgi:anion-transporting  ArsA/GET3 family ATPase